MMEAHSSSVDAVVVGGGISGLTAATYLARAGCSVILLEQSWQVGGRARSQTDHGYTMNLGPHALYCAGPGLRVLRDLGVPLPGQQPRVNGKVLFQDRLSRFPASLRGIVTSDWLPWPDRLEIVRCFAALARPLVPELQTMPLRLWLDQAVHHKVARQFLQAMVRLATYTDAPEQQSAGAALEMLRSALYGNVLYLDGGWQTIVDTLIHIAQTAGVILTTGAKAIAIEHDRMVTGIRLADGRHIDTTAVIIAAAPQTLSTLITPGAAPEAQSWIVTATPIYAACLDVALEQLPHPEITFGLGIDRPYYYAVHSAAAQLAPVGGALVHVMKYLTPGMSSDPRTINQELETWLDQLQPGWRTMLVKKRYLPHLTVSHAIVTTASSGIASRPVLEIASIPGLFLAGDWVGSVGQLADASLASARQAAQLCEHYIRQSTMHSISVPKLLYNRI